MSLTGNEVLYVNGIAEDGGLAATLQQTTTGAIANLAAVGVYPDIVNTNITTVGNGTLTAAGIVGGLITRSGSLADFTDTTDTAVNIVAALAAYVASESFYIKIKNTTAFAQTLSAGAGVTLSGSSVIPPNSVGTYLVTITSATAVAIAHVETGPRTTKTLEIVTNLTTVGDGTITAAGIAGGNTKRTGPNTAFTDTTDTADNIIAAQPNVHIGDSWEYTYINNSSYPATLTGGSGVTVSGTTNVIASHKTTRYLVTYTAASTITITSIGAGASGPGFFPCVLKCSTQKDATSTTLANITGLTGQNLVAGATYRFRCVLPGTADGTGGIKYAFKYTTATLTSIEATGIGYTASAVEVQHTTTTTDQALLFDQAAAVIMTIIEGTMVVNAAGTVALQNAQHAANGTSSTYVGATMEFIRID